MARDHSDLEVAPEANLPEPVQPGKIYYEDAPKEAAIEINAVPPRQIFGLPPRRFWIILCGIILIVAAAAIGGGVGATQAARSKPNNSDNSTSGNNTNSKDTSTSQPATATTNPPATLTTSLQIGPTQTLYRDCPSSNNTIYNALGSSDYQFRKFCNLSFRWSGADLVNTPAKSLNECVNMCVAYSVNNKTAIADRKSTICNAVCWRNDIKDRDWPGQCFGSTVQNSSDTGFPINTEETICDSAAWVNQHFP